MRVIEAAHVKTKALIREKVLFPGIHKDVEGSSVQHRFWSWKYFKVTHDDYSRYVFVDVLPSLSHQIMIPPLDKLLSVMEKPNIIKSDNGPPFNGAPFAKNAAHMGFKHRKITPFGHRLMMRWNNS